MYKLFITCNNISKQSFTAEGLWWVQSDSYVNIAKLAAPKLEILQDENKGV